MSQITRYTNGSPAPGTVVQTLTGNTGGPVGPDASNNIDIVGSGDITVTGNPGTNTLTISSSTVGGIVTLDGDAGSATGSTVTISGGTTGLTTSASASTMDLAGTLIVDNGGTGANSFTANGVLYGNSTSAIGVTAAGTTGQVLTGVTLGAPIWASPAASSISITGDTGGTLTGNSFTFTGGTTGLSFAGATSTETLGGTLVVSNGGTGITSTTAYAPICGGTTTTGNFQSADSGISNSGYVLTSNGSAALPSWQAAGSAGITTAAGDTGTATGSTVTWNANTNSGKTVTFSAASSTVSLNVTNANRTTAIGSGSGAALTTGVDNLAIGYNSLNSASSSGNNVALGSISMASATTGNGANVAVGYNSLNLLTTGEFNVAVGSSAGLSYTSTESNNILLNSTGTLGESNVLRIGSATGTGTRQLSKAFIAGIAGVTVSNKSYVTIDTSTGQLGSETPLMLMATVNLTNSQIKNIAATPITIVSAPGSGKMVRVVSAVSILNYGGNNAFTATDALGLYYGSFSGPAAIGSLLSAGNLVATTNTIMNGVAAATSGAATAINNINLVITASTSPSGNAANDNTITVEIVYYISNI